MALVADDDAVGTRPWPGRLLDAFVDHPRLSGVGYIEHGRTALWLGRRLVSAGLAVSVHALLPFLFDRSASACVAELHVFFARRRARDAMIAAGKPPPSR